MRPEERNPAYLWDMLEAAHAIMEFTGDRSLEEFVASDKEARIIRMAIERNLEILGEAGRRAVLVFVASTRRSHGRRSSAFAISSAINMKRSTMGRFTPLCNGKSLTLFRSSNPSYPSHLKSKSDAGRRSAAYREAD